MEILTKILEIEDTVRSLIEKEIHYGQIRFEAVFPGKDLEIRLFQIQVGKDGVRTLGMDNLTKILTRQHAAVLSLNKPVRGIFIGQAQVDPESRLVDKETQQGHIQIDQFLRPAVQKFEKLVLIVLEICGSPVGRNDCTLMLEQPRSGIINLYFGDRYLMRAVLVYYRE